MELDLPGGKKTVLLRKSNRSSRKLISKLDELGLLAAQAEVEAEIEAGADLEALDRGVFSRLSYAQKGDYITAILWSLLSVHHPEISFDDCAEAVPVSVDQMTEFTTRLTDVLNRFDVSPSKAAPADEGSDGEQENPTDVKPKPKKSGRKRSSRKSPSQSSSLASPSKTSGT